MFVDLTGQRFGRLVVLRRDENKIKKDGKQVAQWLCLCDCGNQTTVITATLKRGEKKSCGCLRKETSANNSKIHNTKHGMSNTRIYGIWSKMRCRCSCKTNKDYINYGARGITVCDAWQDFGEFYKWAITNGYNDNASIDRVDNDKGYNPSNCIWTTVEKQANNRRSNIRITHNGKTQTVTEWAKELNIPASRIFKRIQYGYKTEDVLSTRPLKVSSKRKCQNF